MAAWVTVCGIELVVTMRVSLVLIGESNKPFWPLFIV